VGDAFLRRGRSPSRRDALAQAYCTLSAICLTWFLWPRKRALPAKKAKPVVPSSEGAAKTDGRHARSERTRTAIAEALLALLEEGNLKPAAERIAERAGVSRRALFHHFHDVEDLFETVARMQTARVLATVLPLPLEGSTAERVAAAASLFSRVHARVAPVRRAGQIAEHTSPTVAARLAEARAFHRAAVEAMFRPELASVPADRRVAVSAALAAVTSFPTWNELTAHQGVAPSEVPRVLAEVLTALLAPFADNGTNVASPRGHPA
jgi:TetR/AcrR family transcriptional regulator, regulator of autoinduction and epiphytic fitness